METSLIGKALDFGPKECGFESLVSKMLPYNSTAFLVNHINFAIVSKRRWILFKGTKKIVTILALLKKLGVVQSYLVTRSNRFFLTVKLSPFFYKNSSFFRCIRLVSTTSKRFNLKLRTLQILEKSLGETIVVLETSKGIISHKEALKLKLGGKILLVIN